MPRLPMERSRSACLALLVALLWAPLARAQAKAPETKTEAPSADADTGTAPLAEEPSFPPPSARAAVTLGGLGAFVVFYGAAAGASFAFPDVPGASDLRIPVAGPWLAIAHNGCAPNEVDCSDAWVAFRTVITALDGVAQAGSLAIALEGLFMPTQEVAPRAPVNGPTERPTAPKRPAPEQPTSPPPKNLFWVPMPMAVGMRGIGAGVVGRF